MPPVALRGGHGRWRPTPGTRQRIGVCLPEFAIPVMFTVTGDDREAAARHLTEALTGQAHRGASGEGMGSWWLPELGLQHIDGNDNDPCLLVPLADLLARAEAADASPHGSKSSRPVAASSSTRSSDYSRTPSQLSPSVKACSAPASSSGSSTTFARPSHQGRANTRAPSAPEHAGVNASATDHHAHEDRLGRSRSVVPTELIGVKLAARRARVPRWIRVGYSAQMLVLMSIGARTSNWAAASTSVSLWAVFGVLGVAPIIWCRPVWRHLQRDVTQNVGVGVQHARGIARTCADRSTVCNLRAVDAARRGHDRLRPRTVLTVACLYAARTVEQGSDRCAKDRDR